MQYVVHGRTDASRETAGASTQAFDSPGLQAEHSHAKV
jgi:hypothetical protein